MKVVPLLGTLMISIFLYSNEPAFDKSIDYLLKHKIIQQVPPESTRVDMDRQGKTLTSVLSRNPGIPNSRWVLRAVAYDKKHINIITLFIPTSRSKPESPNKLHDDDENHISDVLGFLMLEGSKAKIINLVNETLTLNNRQWQEVDIETVQVMCQYDGKEVLLLFSATNKHE
jgi:hypothetical protein